jgi:AcrR family transcriptional regulator
MARWEPNARERLRESALELFVQQGYECTTVAQIAERAGLTKSTFFRHFADKQEVLFWGQDELVGVVVEAIGAAPGAATAIDVVRAALEAAAGAFGQRRRASVQQRQTVIETNSGLRERELLKSTLLATAMADALRARGVPGPAASLAAELGNLALRNTFRRWLDPENQRDFAELAHQELDGLRAASTAL